MILVTLAYREGWTYGRTDVRTIVQMLDDVMVIKPSVSRIDGLPYFLNNGSPRARAARGAPLFANHNPEFDV